MAPLQGLDSFGAGKNPGRCPGLRDAAPWGRRCAPRWVAVSQRHRRGLRLPRATPWVIRPKSEPSPEGATSSVGPIALFSNKET